MLVLCRPHLTRKWKREVEETIPGCRAVIASSITDLERLRTVSGSAPLFVVMSRERAKLSYRWLPATIERLAVADAKLIRSQETDDPVRIPSCPDCGAQVADRDGVPLTEAELTWRKRRCSQCGSALWQADSAGPRRYPLAGYLKLGMRAFFDLLIGDEIRPVAQKLQSSLAVEGELPGDGRAAYGDDLMLALTRKRVSGEQDTDSVESACEQAQRVAADAEALLVDDDWRPAQAKPQLLTVALRPNAHGRSVEVVPCGQHAQAPLASSRCSPGPSS